MGSRTNRQKLVTSQRKKGHEHRRAAPDLSLWDLSKFQDILFCSLKDTSLVLAHGCCLDFSSVSSESKTSCPTGTHVC